MAASVRVTDGQLNLTVGGSNPYINGLEITPVLLAPSGLNYSEMSFEGNSASRSEEHMSELQSQAETHFPYTTLFRSTPVSFMKSMWKLS